MSPPTGLADPTISPQQSPTRSWSWLPALALTAVALLAALAGLRGTSGRELWQATPAVGRLGSAAAHAVRPTPSQLHHTVRHEEEELPEGDPSTIESGAFGERQSWVPGAATFGGALTAVAVGLAALFSGRRSGPPSPQTAEGAPLKGFTRPSWAMATVAGSMDDSSRTTFLVGILWFFAHQLIGVGNDVIMKYAGGNLAVAQIVFMRFAFATLTMLPFMAASGPEAFQTNRLPLHFVRSLLLAGGIGLYCTGLTIAPIAVVTTLNFTIPLFTLVLSRVFLDEKVGPLRWCATLAGFLGVLVVLQPAQMAFNPKWLVILLGSAMFASLDVLNKAFVGKESFWAMIFYTALFTAGITAYPAYQVWSPVSLLQMRLLAALGAGANLLLYCLLKSFSRVDASALAPFRYTELLLSALVGFLIFAEIPAVTTLLGAGVIIPSTLFLAWQESRTKEEDDAGALGTATA